VKKRSKMDIGVVTQEHVAREQMDCEIGKLFKRPFWCLGRDYYGAAVCMARNRTADGIIYLSSFSCGVDSVITELIKNDIGDFPFMILKLDEHTGEAGFNTRLEAFSDMLRRRT